MTNRPSKPAAATSPRLDRAFRECPQASEERVHPGDARGGSIVGERPFVAGAAASVSSGRAAMASATSTAPSTERLPVLPPSWPSSVSTASGRGAPARRSLSASRSTPSTASTQHAVAEPASGCTSHRRAPAAPIGSHRGTSSWFRQQRGRPRSSSSSPSRRACVRQPRGTHRRTLRPRWAPPGWSA